LGCQGPVFAWGLRGAGVAAGVLDDMDNMDTLTETIDFHRFQNCHDRGAAMRKSVVAGDITCPACRTDRGPPT
jgi:hypothetical protein